MPIFMRISRPEKKTFPVNFLLEGRRVLVVGGGRVGQRKLELLLDSGAQIVLVAPDCVPELANLAEAGEIDYRNREFQTGDLDGVALAFACTDDRATNREILQAARVAHVPCCCADGNWPDGDFVTPAIIRSDDLTLAVSTGGKSCRLARLVKENLRRHIDSVEGSDLTVIGTSHECLSATERQPYHLSPSARQRVGEMIRQVWGVQEFLLLNTCNRIELIAAISREADASGILRRLLQFDKLPPDGYYVKQGFSAFSHLCSVTAGMDSQTPGEFHVVSQVKEALEEAEANGWAGPIIRELTDATFHVSKDIRHAIGSLLDVEEIEDVALRFMDHASRMLQGRKRALVIGTGVLGTGLLRGLLQRGFTCAWAYHTHRPETPEGVRLIQLGEIATVLPQTDLVMSAVDVKSPVVTSERHAAFLNPQGSLLIDLGMPRNLDPALAGMKTMLADLDVLKHWHRTMNGTLGQARAICQRVLEEHREFYERIHASLRGANSGDAK